MIIPTPLPSSNSQQNMATTGAVLEAIGALAVFVILLFLGFMLLGALTRDKLRYARVDELTLPVNQPLIPRRSRISRTKPRNITSHPRQLAEEDLNGQYEQSSYGTMSKAVAYAELAAEEFDAEPSFEYRVRSREPAQGHSEVCDYSKVVRTQAGTFRSPEEPRTGEHEDAAQNANSPRITVDEHPGQIFESAAHNRRAYT
jgi:hypothetical protein